MYKKYNDYELIYQVRENDEFCSDVILKKYEPILHSIVNEYYYNFSKYGLEKEDFYQEALLAFFRALSSYNDNINCSFYSFVIICIRRKLISLCKSISNSNKNISNDYLEDITIYDICDSKANISDKVNFEEIELIIKRTMYSFPIENSSIFELKYNNFSYKEISLLLDVPIRTVEYKYRKMKSIIGKVLYRNGF